VLCLGAIQLLSGSTWAAYELAMALMLLQGIPRAQRTSMLTWYNFGNSAAMVLGGLLGWAVLQTVGEAHTTYLMIFSLSSVVRLCMVPLLMRVKA
jgi:MFS family permease